MKSLKGLIAVIQDQGDRDYQEDDYGMLDVPGIEHTLLVLTDGMGGHVGGAAASNIVTKSFIKSYQGTEGAISDRLQKLAVLANENIAKTIQEQNKLNGMGSTLIATVISDNGIEWVSIGDSPMWLYRDGNLIRLNEDHSMAPVFNELVEMGNMSREEADNDPKRHTLRSAITGEDLKLIDTSSQPMAIRNTDLLIMASDGIETLSEFEIIKTLEQTSSTSLEEKAEALIQAVKNQSKEDQDNISIILYRPENAYGKEANQIISSSIKHNSNEKKPFNRIKQIVWLVSIILLLIFFIFLFVIDPKNPSRKSESSTTGGKSLPSSEQFPPMEGKEKQKATEIIESKSEVLDVEKETTPHLNMDDKENLPVQKNKPEQLDIPEQSKIQEQKGIETIEPTPDPIELKKEALPAQQMKEDAVKISIPEIKPVNTSKENLKETNEEIIKDLPEDIPANGKVKSVPEDISDKGLEEILVDPKKEPY